jgi:hypothetical protein
MWTDSSWRYSPVRNKCGDRGAEAPDTPPPTHYIELQTAVSKTLYKRETADTSKFARTSITSGSFPLVWHTDDVNEVGLLSE